MKRKKRENKTNKCREGGKKKREFEWQKKREE
jgi:hypothetical protein